MAGAQDQDLEPLLTTQQNQLDLVLAQGDSIDNKALAILASNVALLIFIGQAELGLAWWWIIILLAPFVVSLCLNGLAIRPRAYQGPMVDLDHHPAYLKLGREALILQLLADAKQAVRHNLGLNKLRWRYCIISIICSVAGTVALFGILIV